MLSNLRLGSAAAALLLLLLAHAPAANEAEPLPSIRTIMQQSHSCRNNHIYQIKGELRYATPDWCVVESRSSELVRMGRLLAKNTPPRGSPASWEELTDLYVARAILLTDAARRQDQETAVLYQKQLIGMCATCHRAHR